MNLGHGNEKMTYTMKDEEGARKELNETNLEKDLGLYVDNKLTFHHHIDESVKKANRVLGLIKRTFVSRDILIIKKLYTTMARPIMEYENSARIHQYAGDTDKVERVQRRATKLCAAIRDLPYQESLKAMKLPSMHFRHERGDMIQVYKILTDRDRVKQEKLLPLHSVSRTRGHGSNTRKSIAG